MVPDLKFQSRPSAMLIGVFFCLLVVTSVRAEPTVHTSPQYFKTPGNGLIMCNFSTQLADCRLRAVEHLHKSFDIMLDFSSGERSPNVTLVAGIVASYAGKGLAAGHCGVQFKCPKRVYLALGVDCYGMTVGGLWTRGFAILDASGRSSPNTTGFPETDHAILFTTQGPLDTCFVWTPAAGQVEVSSREAAPAGSRYRPHGRGVREGNCGVKLVNVTFRDAGVWVSRGFKRSVEAEAAHSTVLIVNAAPMGDHMLRVRDSANLRVGSLLNATCQAPPSVPPAKLTWRLNGTVVRQDDVNDTMARDIGTTFLWEPMPSFQTFTRRLTAEDFGTRLECRMDHPLLDGGKRVGQELLEFSVSAERSVIRTAIEYQTNLVCIVDPRLNVTVAWSRAGVPVHNSALHKIGNNLTHHWLLLEDTSLEDLTNFTCNASNAGGSVSQVIQLTGLPGVPQWATPATQSQLAWNVESFCPLTDGLLKIRREKGQWQTNTTLEISQVEEGLQKVVFDRLQGEPPGLYAAYVKVKNKNGWSSASEVQHFNLSIPAGNSTGCPSLATRSRKVTCWLAGVPVDCSSAPTQPSLTALVQCVAGYRPPGNQSNTANTTCTKSGWRPQPLACTFDCGRRKSQGMSLTAGGTEARVSEFPWHVAVFHMVGSLYQPICGGSLVSLKFFVSAAHCFWNITGKKPYNESMYMAVLGKHTLHWTTIDDNEQRRNIAAIHMPEHFAGYEKNLEADIAIVQLSQPVQVTPAVNVVCVDWNKTFENQQLTNNSMGIVPGWGYTENDTMSPTLRFVDLPFVPFRDCEDSVPSNYREFLLRDKMCGGYSSRTISVCPGDSGSGFVFPARKEGDVQRYYLRGVVSSSPILTGLKLLKCQTEHRSLFTKILSFEDFWKESMHSANNKAKGKKKGKRKVRQLRRKDRSGSREGLRRRTVQ